MSEQQPLRYEIKEGILSISIGVGTLAWAAVHEPRQTPTAGIKITDITQFAKDVLHELQDEEEDGSTLVTELLDKACGRAYEQGSLGVDYE